jgi:lipopolysaccharide transport system permease protein
MGAVISADAPILRIRPSRGWTTLNLRELWHYRELVYFLTWRDIQVRYKQTALGVAWIVLQPLLTILVFTVIFGKLARLPSDNLPYAAFALAGLVPWNFFAGAFSRGSLSLVGSANLISKVYFPRLVIPIASVLAGAADLAISLLVLFGLTVYYEIMPTTALAALPVYLLLALAAALGVGLWLSALSVQYRDVAHAVPFFTQLWFYATPIVYPITLVPAQFRVWLGLNPMATVAEGFRWAVLGKAAPPAPMVLLSVTVVAVLLLSGAYVFRRMERTFADVV